MTTRRSQTTYTTIRTEGGLLPPDLLDRVQKLDGSLDGLKPADYRLKPDERVNTQISEAWQAIQTHWASFRRTMERVSGAGESGTSATRNWVQQVLYELGYGELRFVPGAERIGDRSFLISHRAGEAENAPPMHIVSFRQGLDERAGRTGGGEQRSPHALMQGYLNASDHLWGVVTNGLVVRLLRENRQIDRTLRVDFDLEGMLEAESFAEFRLFWLVLHRSRLVQSGDRRENAWLERWSQTAASEGTRALTGLRDGVETAIEKLGQGLLTHPNNVWLREQLAEGKLGVDDYYSELLRLVYRLLFLLVAEERQLLFRRPPESEERRTGTGPVPTHALEGRYRRHYSVERLREEASRVRDREAHHDDLWRGLLVTFDAMRYPTEAHALGLEPLGGGLFGGGSCPHVADDPAPGSSGTMDDRPMLSNTALLDAIQALSEVTRDGVTRRVNYRDLDVEELGSVYEGLLEHRPSLTPEPSGSYRFGFSESTSRRETGSYYTPRSLVQELLTSALDPVIDAALERASTTEAKERVLLDLNVCDPACGSGHFLLGAARRIGRRLAEVRVGTDREPEPGDLRHATAEAIRHCVYGVDKNPLAIDLCKVALWIESHEPGGPIGFLDHHIKRGDSLVGVFDLDVLQEGIPDDAYKPVTGDDKQVARDLRDRNKAERSKLVVQEGGSAVQMHNASLFAEGEREDILKALGARLREIDAMPEGTVEEVQAKAAAYAQVQGRQDWNALWTACDLWTWSFFAPLSKSVRADSMSAPLVPTSGTVRQMVETGNVRGDLIGAARGDGQDVGFFHWRLAFPDVFGWQDRAGGFDAVLGNPPWERVKLQEKEFFAEHDPEIANAPNKAARDRLIRKLPETNPALADSFEQAKREAENASLFMRGSERFPLTGRGDVNLYSVFAEHFCNVIAPMGRAGVIVPTGIATDDSNKAFFSSLVAKQGLVAFYGFENEDRIFPGVHHAYKFALMTVSGGKNSKPIDLVFFARQAVDVHDPSRRFSLSSDEFQLLNPNTLTCPIFRSARDAELTKQIYRAAPVLVDESRGEDGDPWGVTFDRMFDMSNDSHLFHTRENLEERGTLLGQDGHFCKSGGEWKPLYEGKMIQQFDHRFGTYKGQTPEQARQGKLPEVTDEQHADPSFVIEPRYWVATKDVARAIGQTSLSKYLGFRRTASSVNRRTGTFTALPDAAAGDSLFLITGSKGAHARSALLLANFNSFIADYALRQKLGGVNVNFYVIKQLPVLPPEAYTEDLLDRIVPRVLELTYTAHDMAPFARDLGYDGPPFIWDEERREQLRAELDSIYAHLYGISRDDFAYILDTFPIVARKDIEQHGEYRTKRLCLEAYDHFAPETLRTLELEVRDIEHALRRVIVQALDNDPDNLPADLKASIMEERMRHRPNGADGRVPPLRELLESSYLRHLDKIVRSDLVWPKLESQFGSKSDFKRQFGRLNAFRNPLAHGRSVDENVRRSGEEAIAWFRDRLGQVLTVG